MNAKPHPGVRVYVLLGLCTPYAALAARVPAADPAGVTIAVANGHIDFRAGTDLVARYHTGLDAAKPYLWPLNGPGGVPLTRAWPMEKGRAGETTDHVHHKSVWFCHGDVIPEGLVKLARGEHLRLRYGLLIHPGDAAEGKVAENFRRFVGLKGGE